MKLLFKLLLFICGFLGMVFLFYNIPSPKWRTHFFDKRDIAYVSAFEKGPHNKVAIVGHCTLTHYETFNNKEKNDLFGLEVSGLLGEILNITALENKLPVKFYTFGRPSTGPRDFTFYLYHILERSQIKHVIFNLDWGALHSHQITDLASSLEMIYILNLLSKKYPDLQEDIQHLLKVIWDSPETKDAIKVYGSNFQQYVDAQTLTLPRYDTEGGHSYWFKDLPKEISAIRSFMGLDFILTFQELQHPFRNAAAWIQYLLFQATGGEDGYTRQVRESFLKNTLQMDENYDDPYWDHSVVAPAEGDYLGGSEGDFYLRWLELMYKIATKNGVTLTYFLLPDISISEEMYKKFYGPSFAGKVISLAKKYNQPVIDRTLYAHIGPKDLVTKPTLITYNLRQESKARFKVPRQFNIAGKVKLADIILDHLYEELGASTPKERFLSKYLQRFRDDRNNVRLVSPKDVFDIDKPAIFQAWMESLGSQYSTFFGLNQTSPEEYFESSVYPTLLKQEAEWLLGGGRLEYKCPKAQKLCGPTLLDRGSPAFFMRQIQ